MVETSPPASRKMTDAAAYTEKVGAIPMLCQQSRNDSAPGKIQDHEVKERRMLLDDYLPEFDVRTSYATRIVAPPARVYASLWTANFDYWGVTRALYAARTLPSFLARPRETWRRFHDELFRKRFTLDAMLSE